MKKTFLTCAIALASCVFAQAAITCTFLTIHIDTNQTYPLDIDDDGTNDFLLQTAYTPYVNNFITGLNGNEIEVTAWSGNDANRCRRIESGDPVGSLAWNDTAYLIENGQGAFSGGSEEYGHVGLRLNKSGNYHYAFLQARAPYWQALLEVYAIGYNDAALSETRTDACPQPVGVEEQSRAGVNAFMNGNYIHVSLPDDEAQNAELQIVNVAGQVVLTEKLQQTENDIALNNFRSGVYLAAILKDKKVVQRTKVLIQ